MSSLLLDLGLGISARIDLIEENLENFNQFKDTINNHVDDVESDLNQFKSEIIQKLGNIDLINDDVTTNYGLIQSQAQYNEETFLKKSTFNNTEDGVLLVNNGVITKLDKPEVPSVLIFDGDEFKWQPYKEYEL